MTIEAHLARNRFGLGARPGERPPADPRGWLEAQLTRFDVRPAPISAMPGTAEIAGVTAEYLAERRMLRRRERGMSDAAQMAADTAVPTQGGQRRPMAQRMPNPARRAGRDFYVRAVGARTLAALGSETPFVERMVHFWANHFAVSAEKQTMVGLAGAFEFEAIRPHVLGSFGEMLHAVERHPAMLLYLDQAQSVGPASPQGQAVAARGRRRAGLNENLAREIMELHTLGVNGGYGQADVTEFAKAMTGWTVAGLGRGRAMRRGVAAEPGSFVFMSRLHEPGARTILGEQYAQAGEAQAAAVLDRLALHPATAKHVASKLARHFAGDTPPPALVARLEAAFTRSRGDLPAVYRALIASPEAWAPAQAKFKSPWEWTIASMRGLGIAEIPPQQIFGLQQQLGQPVWRPGSPAGYDDIAATWAGPDALMRRVEAAERLVARNREPVDARARAAELYPAALSEATAQAIARAESPAQGLALLLVAPEALRR